MKTVIAPLPAPDWGGLHAVLATIVPYLADFGFRIVPVVPPDASDVVTRLRDAGMEPILQSMGRLRRSLDPRQNFPFAAGLIADSVRLSRLARDCEAELFQVAGLQHVSGALAARMSGAALVWQIHSDFLPKPARQILTPFARLVSDCIMVNGDPVRRAFPGLRRYPSNQIVPFTAPIEPDLFTFSQAERTDARKRIGVRTSDIVIGTIGNRGFQKAHERLVEAVGELVQGGRQVVGVVLGAKIESNVGYYEGSVLARARELGLIAQRQFLFIEPGAAVRDYISAFDIFAMPSRAEGIPVALVEGIATGLPVVASDVGSISDAVIPNLNGFLIHPSPFDQSAFVAALAHIADNKNVARKMGAASRQIALDKFSAETVAAAHAKAYEIALSNRRAK